MVDLHYDLFINMQKNIDLFEEYVMGLLQAYAFVTFNPSLKPKTAIYFPKNMILQRSRHDGWCNHGIFFYGFFVRSEGLEPSPFGAEIRRSIQLNYERLALTLMT